jgi:hypothetical protein
LSCGKQQGPVAAQAEQVESMNLQTPLPTVDISKNGGQNEKTDPNPGKPVIVSRQEWKAKMPIGEAKQHSIRFITIHHTASLQKKGMPIERKMQSLQNFSQSKSQLASGKMKPVWFDVPYHYYIAVDGKIAEGREIQFVGDTNTDYDPTGHALIVLEGDFQTEHPSDAQMESLRNLVVWLSHRWNVPSTNIKAHNDYASTICPGENLKALLPKFREKVDETMKLNKGH